MKATRSIMAAMVLEHHGGTKVSAQCAATLAAATPPPYRVGQSRRVVKLGMSGTTTSLTAPTADDIDAGAVIDNVGPTFTIKANRSWTLKIKSVNAATWTYAGSNSGVKPIGDLAWSTVNGGTYAAITNSDATFASGAGATNSGVAAAFFRTTWLSDFADASNREGTYSLPIMFTLTAP